MSTDYKYTEEVIITNAVDIVMNQSNFSGFKRLEFYIANIISQYLIKDKGHKDSDFEFMGWITPITFCYHNASSLTRSKNKSAYGIETGSFVFKFKGEKVLCTFNKCTDEKNVKPYISMEDHANKTITIKFFNESSNHLAYNILKNATVYVDKYILECDDGDNNIEIYCNDDGYWEKCMSRRKRRLDTIYLPKQDKDLILQDIKTFLLPSTIERYESIGRTHKRVYLFEGLPGTGKTSFIIALASHFDYNVAVISFTEKVTDGVLTRLLKNLPEKCILVMEDIDVLFTDRKKNDEHKNMITFSGILNNLDGITTQDGFICFITTNFKNTLDSALLRPGRIDKQLKFDIATKEQIHDMFIKFMGELYTEIKFKEFYKGYVELGIATTICVIQEYLFKYIDSPDLAIQNIDELMKIYTASITDKTDMYT